MNRDNGINAFYSLIGHGANNQIKDVAAAKSALKEQIVDPLNKEWGGEGTCKTVPVCC